MIALYDTNNRVLNNRFDNPYKAIALATHLGIDLSLIEQDEELLTIYNSLESYLALTKKNACGIAKNNIENNCNSEKEYEIEMGRSTEQILEAWVTYQGKVGEVTVNHIQYLIFQH